MKAPARTVALLAAALVAAACSTAPTTEQSRSQPPARGRYVLFAYVPAAGTGGALKVLDRRTGRYVTRRPPPAAQAALPVPSPDGRYCAVPDFAAAGGNGGRIALTSTATGELSWVRTPVVPESVSWSPDGRRLAVLGAPSGGRVAVATVDVATHATAVRSLQPPAGGLRPTSAMFDPAGSGLVVSYAAAGERARPDDRLSFYPAGGRPVRSLRVGGTPVGGRPWSPSGHLMTLLADPARDGLAAQLVTVDVRTGGVVGHFALDGSPVGWLDEAHLAVAAVTDDVAGVDSVELHGLGRRNLISLPADAARPATVFVVPADDVPAAASRYEF